MKTKTVYRKSVFPADIKRVFSLLKNPETLQYIARPYASFAPINGSGGIRWKKWQKLLYFR